MKVWYVNFIPYVKILIVYHAIIIIVINVLTWPK